MSVVTHRHDKRCWVWLEHPDCRPRITWKDNVVFSPCSGVFDDQPLIVAAEAAADAFAGGKNHSYPLFLPRQASGATGIDPKSDVDGEDSDEDNESDDGDESEDSDEDNVEPWARVMLQLAGQKRRRTEDDAPASRALVDAIETYGILSVQGNQKRAIRRLAAAAILETVTQCE
jgi:hypothetical protein